jgi:hypothetical protein
MRKHRRLILLLLVATLAAIVPLLVHAKHRWDDPGAVTWDQPLSYTYGLNPLTTQITCDLPARVIQGSSHTVTCRFSTRKPLPGETGEVVVQHSPVSAAEASHRPRPTPADDAQFQRDLAQSQNLSLRSAAVEGLSDLAETFSSDDRYQIALAKVQLADTSTSIEGLKTLQTYPDDPEAAQAIRQAVANSQLWLSATHADDPYQATAQPLDFAPGRPVEPLGNAAGLNPPQSATFTLQASDSDHIVVNFKVNLTRESAGNRIDDSLESANFTIPVNVTWAHAVGTVAIGVVLILAAIAITLLFFAGLIFAAGKLFPVLALDRWKQSRIARLFRWTRRHWVTVLYVVLAVIFLAPDPFQRFQTNRQAYHHLLDLFIGFSFRAGDYTVDQPTDLIAWTAIFLGPLLGGLARLLPVRHRLTAFLLNILVPALAVAFCLEELLLFFGSFLLEYLAIASEFVNDNPFFMIVLIVIAALAFTGIAGAVFRRLSPRHSLYYAGLAITLTAIAELLLFSAAYYAGHVSVDIYGSKGAFDRLPIYIWVGIGFLIQSDLFSAPEKPRRGPSTSKAADSAQTFALTAIALCAFGVTQIPHSMDNLNRLQALRHAFATDTLVDRTERKPNSDPVSYIEKTSAVPTPPFGEFDAAGLNAHINIVEIAKGHDGLIDVTVTEQNGPNQTSTWTEGLNPVYPGSHPQPGAALQRLLNSTDKDIHQEAVFEHLYHEAELKIVSETTSIPGTPVQVSSQYISWCLLLLNIVLLFLIEDRLKLAETRPEDACDSYLLWGNTLITRTLAVIWPFWLAFSLLLQVAGVTAITLFQGLALGWLLLPLLILASCVAPVAFSIAMSCYRIRRAIRQSLAPCLSTAPDPDPIPVNTPSPPESA